MNLGTTPPLIPPTSARKIRSGPSVSRWFVISWHGSVAGGRRALRRSGSLFLAMRIRQLSKTLEVEVDLGRIRRYDRGAAALSAKSAVDPGAGEAGAFGRDMVMMQALSGVENLRFANAEIGFDMFDEISEVAGVGLVGSDVLGGV